ncbi:hypothetical protein QBC46DRAFT_368822 [Diplogelasinospora grovesii]|uniref:Uncharacterized protein n=1 Tax=Diplogelasinospora grovesii TaxID=303347 RepID=A0AAN6NJ71_9PEZI|nr:hypothetical protein QBC46DRAFT_368822 [Diplogelasinospora grovesii]
MRTLFNFRQVNRRAREVVDWLSEWQKAITDTDGLDFLYTLLRNGVARFVTPRVDFHNLLCRWRCVSCGAVRRLFFLEDRIRRFCWFCHLWEDTELFLGHGYLEWLRNKCPGVTADTLPNFGCREVTPSDRKISTVAR